MPNVDAKSFYFNKKYVHAQNERLYTANDHPRILDQFQINVPLKHKRKYMQFVAIFNLLTHGCPMTDYQDLKDLF
jgi:hypothetical protein